MLAGFPDGRADEGPTAAAQSLLGLRIAAENGLVARRRCRDATRPERSSPGARGGGEPWSTLLTPVLTANWGDERAWKLHQLRAPRRLPGACARR